MGYLHHGKNAPHRKGKEYDTGNKAGARVSGRVRNGATAILLGCALFVGMAGASALSAVLQ